MEPAEETGECAPRCNSRYAQIQLRPSERHTSEQHIQRGSAATTRPRYWKKSGSFVSIQQRPKSSIASGRQRPAPGVVPGTRNKHAIPMVCPEQLLKLTAALDGTFAP